MEKMKRVEKIKTFFTFDLLWLLVHLIMEPFVKIKEIFFIVYDRFLLLGTVKEVERLLFALFILSFFFGFSRIMVGSFVLFICAHAYSVYLSGKHIYTMRKLTRKDMEEKSDD